MRNALHYFHQIIESGNDFRKSIMICEIADSVDDHFLVDIFNMLEPFVSVIGKEPADCKLMLEIVNN